MNKNVQETDICNVVVKKRGRKSKKDIEQALIKSKEKEQEQDNIVVLIEEKNYIESDGKIVSIDDILSNSIEYENNEDENVDDTFLIQDTQLLEDHKPIPKKRGRKPKGGKIIQQIVPINNNKDSKPNVILHLKCSLKDLQTNTLLGSNIESFNFSANKNDFSYEIINSNDNNIIQNNTTQNEILNVTSNKYFDDEPEYDEEHSVKNKENDIKDVWKKLKVLEHNLHINNISDKKSACFWCTYEFDNPPIYIPKHYIKDAYNVYGCFCSPECATAYLMEENIDSSSKFERYHLLNHIYSKIYDYKKNIKPAPNPYYMLEKYYGNLNIQEYRSLLRNERLFLVVDKPLTRILPELHEDNDDFIINNKIIPSNTYQIKKKLHKKQQNKTNILSEKFGISQ